MNKDFSEVPLSESHVTLRLSKIQKRCAELLQEPDALEDLSIEDDPLFTTSDPGDPYNHG